MRNRRASSGNLPTFNLSMTEVLDTSWVLHPIDLLRYLELFGRLAYLTQIDWLSPSEKLKTKFQTLQPPMLSNFDRLSGDVGHNPLSTPISHQNNA